MKIRQEIPNDYRAVYQLVQSAFETADFADGNEQEIIEKLRASEAFIPELSLVAEIKDEIVGHILFTEGHIGETTVLVLAPLSVLPIHQKCGVGRALIAEGHRRAKGLGYSFSLVLGSENYYPKFGYLPAADFGVTVPEGIPSMNFMACPLTTIIPQLDGALRYASEFGVAE